MICLDFWPDFSLTFVLIASAISVFPQLAHTEPPNYPFYCSVKPQLKEKPSKIVKQAQ